MTLGQLLFELRATQKGEGLMDGRTYSQNGTYVTFPLIFLAILVTQG
jgi:hypothetical protein